MILNSWKFDIELNQEFAYCSTCILGIFFMYRWKHWCHYQLFYIINHLSRMIKPLNHLSMFNQVLSFSSSQLLYNTVNPTFLVMLSPFHRSNVSTKDPCVRYLAMNCCADCFFGFQWLYYTCWASGFSVPWSSNYLRTCSSHTFSAWVHISSCLFEAIS